MTQCKGEDTFMKRCSKCGKMKPLSEFYCDKMKKDGFRGACKVCMREQARQYYAANQEERREYGREYYNTNLEKCRERNRKWCTENPEKHCASNLKSQKAHPESHNKASRKWRAANPDYIREWMKANPEKANAKTAKRRALKAKVTVGDMTAIARIYDLAANGTRVRCYLCGKLIPKGQRHVDHIIPLSKGGLHVASNLAIACAACNLSKATKLPEEVGILI